MRIVMRNDGWIVLATWLGSVRVVFGPDSIWDCILFTVNDQR